MNDPSPSFAPSNPCPRASHLISIVYEDRVAGLRAKYFADRLTASFPQEEKCSITMWRCELFEFSGLVNYVATETAPAELVVLSLRGNVSLSYSMKHFVESWLQMRTSEAPALITLCDPRHNDGRIMTSNCSYLEHVTSGAGVHFFSRQTLNKTILSVSAYPSLVRTRLRLRRKRTRTNGCARLLEGSAPS